LNRNRSKEDKIYIFGTDIPPFHYLCRIILENEKLAEIVGEFSEDFVGFVNMPESLTENMYKLYKYEYIKSELTEKLRKVSLVANKLDPFTKWCYQILKQFEGAYEIHQNDNYLLRDKLIFENINALDYIFPDSKFIIAAAHNAHVEKRSCYFNKVFKNSVSFGTLLSQKYNSQYYCIATDIDSGYFANSLYKITPIKSNDKKISSMLCRNFNGSFIYIDSDLIKILNSITNNKLEITNGTSIPTDGGSINCSNLVDVFDSYISVRKSTPSSYNINYSNSSFNLFMKLSSETLNEIKNTKKVEVSFKSTYTRRQNSNDSIMMRVYFYDRKQKIIKFYTKPVKPGFNRYVISLPSSIQTISPIFAGTNLIYCRIENLLFNDKIIEKSNIILSSFDQDYHKNDFYKLQTTESKESSVILVSSH